MALRTINSIVDVLKENQPTHTLNLEILDSDGNRQILKGVSSNRGNVRVFPAQDRCEAGKYPLHRRSWQGGNYVDNQGLSAHRHKYRLAKIRQPIILANLAV